MRAKKARSALFNFANISKFSDFITCIICVSVWEDNSRAPVSGLSPIQTNKPYSTIRVAQYAFALYVLL